MRQRAFFRAVKTAATEDLRLALGLAADDTPATILLDMLKGGIAPTRWPDKAVLLMTGTATDGKKGALFLAAYEDLRAGRAEEALQKYLTIFFTKNGAGTPVAKLLNNGLAKARPDLLQELSDEQARLDRLRDKRAASAASERTQALASLVNAILDRYETLKAERQLLDFDDLIARARELLTRSSARWVLQKLDAGIDHILVDEAQDTSEAQWDILDRISSDFFAGEGQSRRSRTFFAVGDEKQSIFSFQGAAPALFARKKVEFQRLATAAGKAFNPVDLNLSFRSAQGILDAVDKVFSLPENFRGLSAQADNVRTVHEAWKSNLPSRVEIWDVIAPGVAEEKRDWKLPLDYQDAADPPVAAARRIAQTIARWLEPGSGETVEAEGKRRPIAARRHHDSGAPPRRLFRGDDPRAQGKGRPGGGRRPARTGQAYRGDGPRRRLAARACCRRTI